MSIALNATAAHPCLKLQEGLDRFYSVTPAKQEISTGTLDALSSAKNKAGVRMQLVEGTGARPTSTTNRKIQMRYVPRTCETSGVTWSECSYGDPQDPLWKTAEVYVNRSVDFGFDLTESDYRDMCESLDDGWVAFFDAKYYDAKKRLNDLVVIDTVAAMGVYAGGTAAGDNSVTSPITIPVATPAGAFNPAGFGVIRTAYNQMNISTAPIIVGAGKLDYAANAAVYSGLADTGIDGSKGQFAYFRDPSLNDVFFNDGDDHILSWVPGSIQLAEWFEFVGPYEKTYWFEINNERRVEKTVTTIVMPDGSRWDMLYVYDCGVHKYRFRKWLGVTPLPSDAFGTCQLGNYALHFLAGCEALTCSSLNELVGPGAQSS